MAKRDKIKVVFVSNFSKAYTGFGKNARNILRAFYKDPEIEMIEAANGVAFGQDLRTPWKGYGTYPNDPNVLKELESDPNKKRLAQYGNYMLDEIIKKEKPDIVLGVEDIWAFDWAKKPWFDNLHTVLWTTLDSLPILDQAEILCPKVDKFIVWATFAEEAMKEKGFDVSTIHGAVDYSHFFPLSENRRKELRAENNIDDNYVIGFVFKNQLRKSVPNLLEGFKIFKDKNPDSKAKLFLHTDWPVSDNTWDIPRYIKEKGLDNDDILCTYLCRKCRKYFISSYNGEEVKCKHCGDEKGAVTKSNVFGVSEEELNEIYNMMDVYCQPFTSGGQEFPIQEAKAAGLITLVTEYSCGTDTCYEKDGGIPLKWHEYREPFTQFIKASTCPKSIADGLERVLKMNEAEKEKLIEAGIRCVKEKFAIDRTVRQLREVILKLGKADWDFNFEEKPYNTNFVPEFGSEKDDTKWLLDLYKNIFNKKFSKNDAEIIQGVNLIQEHGRESVFSHLRNVAIKRNEEKEGKENKKKIEDFFIGGDEEKRIAVVIPESAGDVLMINSLISNLKKKHEDYNIYVVTQPQYFCMIDDHPDVANLIPYQSGMDNLLLWEGRGDWNGYVDIAFLPFIGSQRYLNYLHGPDKENYQFNLYSKDFPCKL